MHAIPNLDAPLTAMHEPSQVWLTQKTWPTAPLSDCFRIWLICTDRRYTHTRVLFSLSMIMDYVFSSGCACATDFSNWRCMEQACVAVLGLRAVPDLYKCNEAEVNNLAKSGLPKKLGQLYFFQI